MHCIALCAHNAQLANSHSKKIPWRSFLREATHSAIVSRTIREISSVWSSIGSRNMSRDCKLTGASYMHPWQQWAIWRRKGDKELAMTLDRY